MMNWQGFGRHPRRVIPVFACRDVGQSGQTCQDSRLCDGYSNRASSEYMCRSAIDRKEVAIAVKAIDIIMNFLN
jgi:hypothetical protein